MRARIRCGMGKGNASEPRQATCTKGERMSLKAYKVTHDGMYLGGCSIGVAHDKRRACALLHEAMPTMVYAGGKDAVAADDFEEIDLEEPAVHTLFNGDY